MLFFLDWIWCRYYFFTTPLVSRVVTFVHSLFFGFGGVCECGVAFMWSPFPSLVVMLDDCSLFWALNSVRDCKCWSESARKKLLLRCIQHSHFCISNPNQSPLQGKQRKPMSIVGAVGCLSRFSVSGRNHLERKHVDQLCVQRVDKGWNRRTRRFLDPTVGPGFLDFGSVDWESGGNLTVPMMCYFGPLWGADSVEIKGFGSIYLEYSGFVWFCGVSSVLVSCMFM